MRAYGVVLAAHVRTLLQYRAAAVQGAAGKAGKVYSGGDCLRRHRVTP